MIKTKCIFEKTGIVYDIIIRPGISINTGVERLATTYKVSDVTLKLYEKDFYFTKMKNQYPVGSKSGTSVIGPIDYREVN